MDSLVRDLRWALQSMRKSLGLTIVVVLSLGLAIGANTAVFSVVNAFLLRPLPLRDIGRLVRGFEVTSKEGEEVQSRNPSYDGYLQWVRYNTVFTEVGAALSRSISLTGQGDAERLPGVGITASFLDVLGVHPLLGRNFTAAEDQHGAGHVVILGHSLWARRFGSDPGVIGKAITLNGEPHTVVGVMRPKFRYPYDADLWVPLAEQSDPAHPNWSFYVVGRLKPGISLEQAQRQMASLVKRLAVEQPLTSPAQSVRLTPLRKELIQNLDKLFLLLSSGAAFVLLIACANVSNLLLAQSVGRAGEVAVRVALGATRGRLIRQFLTYSIVLALLGGLAGILLTFWSVKPLVALSPLESIREFDAEPRLDLPTLAFTVAVSLLVGVVFGLIPAFKVSRGNLRDTLTEGGRSKSLTAGGHRILSTFVVLEMALALIVLIGAGLMLRSFQRLHGENQGYDLRNVLTFKVSFPQPKYAEPPSKVAFIREAVQRLGSLPGVVSAGATTTEPLEPGQEYAAFNVEGRPATEPTGYHEAHTRTVTPGYHEAMRIPLLKGRRLTEQDDVNAPTVVVISKSFADHYWPGEEPLGKRVKRGLYTSQRPWLNVVGVVGTLQETPDAEKSIVDAWYLPYTQTTAPSYDEITFALRSSTDPKSLIGAARAAIASIDQDQPIYDALTMEERLDKKTVQERFSAYLCAILGGLGLILATLGIYGVLSFAVYQRTREFGIRTAMGARPWDIKAMILRRALALTVLGLTFGVVVTLLLGRLLTSLLYKVSARDPVALGSALVALAVIALACSYLPARRAAKVDTLRALRYE